jgi:hypothetical protein
MLDAEGAAQPGDLALVGDEAALERAIRGFAAAGATDFNAAVFPHGDDALASLRRTHDFLGALARA